MSKSILYQSGVALLMMTFVLVLVATGFYVKQLSALDIKTERDIQTAEALQEAKAVLLGYALTYDDTHTGERYGYLPCPDRTDFNGSGSDPVCGTAGLSVIGRFPWKTLKTNPVKDGFNECLWYAVSGSYKNNPKQLLVPTTQGQLVVHNADGSIYLSSDIDPIVAIVFSAGQAINGQSRADSGEDVRCGGNYDVSQYLDAINNISNADAVDNTFVVGDAGTQFNDQLMVIRQSEVFEHYCSKYTKKLYSQLYITTTNVSGCKDLDTGSVTTECSSLKDQAQYCAATSCQQAANTLTTTTCLGDLSDATCQAAVNHLSACHV